MSEKHSYNGKNIRQWCRETGLTEATIRSRLRRGWTLKAAVECLDVSRNKGGKLSPSYKHGMAGTSEFLIWCALLARCLNKSNKSYKNYGGRGISVHESWLDFTNFISDMGSRPSDKHSIDRIDNDGNYEPGNCRWATRDEQSNNRRNIKRFLFDGRMMTIPEISALTKIPKGTLWDRVKLQGMTAEQAATK